MKVFYGQASGGFDATPLSLTLGASCPSTPSVADFNEDGWPDLTVTLQGCGSGQGIDVFVNDGTGTGFARTTLSYQVDNSSYVEDMDSDGHVDIVGTGRDGKVHLFWGQGNGSFTSATINDAQGQYGFYRLEDIDGDGDSDLVQRYYYTGEVRVYPNQGARSFGASSALVTHSGATYLMNAHVGDFNGDGKLDITTFSTQTNFVGLDIRYLFGN